MHWTRIRICRKIMKRLSFGVKDVKHNSRPLVHFKNSKLQMLRNRRKTFAINKMLKDIEIFNQKLYKFLCFFISPMDNLQTSLQIPATKKPFNFAHFLIFLAPEPVDYEMTTEITSRCCSNFIYMQKLRPHWAWSIFHLYSIDTLENKVLSRVVIAHLTQIWYKNAKHILNKKF